MVFVNDMVFFDKKHESLVIALLVYWNVGTRSSKDSFQILSFYVPGGGFWWCFSHGPGGSYSVLWQDFPNGTSVEAVDI